MHYKLFIKYYLLIVVLLFVACNSDNSTQPPTDPDPATMNLSGAYLGQTPPGNTPVRFMPNSNFQSNSNWFWHGSPTFSPDGNEMLFVKYPVSDSGTELWVTSVYNSRWTVPQKTTFVQGVANSPVYIAKDTLFYVAGTTTSGPSGIYKIVRTNSAWGAPEKLNIPIPAGHRYGWGFTISKNNNIYLPLSNGNNPNDIFVTKFVNGQYQLAEKLSTLNSDNYEAPNYISPDEQFIIISSNRTGGVGYNDLYISRKNTDGAWGTPVNLGNVINSSSYEHSSLITPDGKYLFFNTEKAGDAGYTPYWVDAKILGAHK